MRQPEGIVSPYPEEALSDIEIKGFVRKDVSNATRYLLGTRFRNISSPDRCPPRTVDIESPNRLDVVRLGIYVGDRRHYSGPSVVISAEGFCPDITDVVPQDIAGPRVWDVASFVFPVNTRNNPIVQRYLIMRNALGKQINANAKQQFFLNQVAEQFGMERSSQLNREDLHVIHSIIDLLSKKPMDSET